MGETDEGIGPVTAQRAAFITPGKDLQPCTARSLAARLLIGRIELERRRCRVEINPAKSGDDTSNVREMKTCVLESVSLPD